MEWKLEIIRELETLRESLDSSIAVLNLPAANYCSRECKGCITKEQGVKPDERLSMTEIKRVIDYFAGNHDTRFITINGRGDPLHPEVKSDTLEKISYSSSRGIRSYVFTPGDNLDEETCRFLAENNVNVMISLFGNRFIDAGFFQGKEYTGEKARIAGNLRRLMYAYGESQDHQQDATTLLGMNYVVSEQDLQDSSRLEALKDTANMNRIFFLSNTNFHPHPDPKVQGQLEAVANRFSDFNIAHSTSVDRQCQMGAGSSATVDYNGELYRCPYMSGKGDGSFFGLTEQEMQAVLAKYMRDRSYVCVLRKTRPTR